MVLLGREGDWREEGRPTCACGWCGGMLTFADRVGAGARPGSGYGGKDLQRFALILDHAVSWRHGCSFRRPTLKTMFSRLVRHSEEQTRRVNLIATRSIGSLLLAGIEVEPLARKYPLKQRF